MPIINLTKRVIDEIPPTSMGQILYRDARLPGFGLRVGRGTPAYFAEGQVDRRTVRVTIAKYGHVTPEGARKLAMRALADMAEGRNRNAEERAKNARSITTKEAFDAFFAGRPGLSQKTVPTYRRTIDYHLKDWANRPLARISRQMILDRHRLIGERNGRVAANTAMRVLRSIYNYAQGTAVDLPPNPIAVLSDTRSWNTERRRRTLISQHALPCWYAAVLREDEHARDFLLVALNTGMRRNEIATLRWEHVGLDARVLTVPRTKNGEPLILPLSLPLYEILLARRDNDPDGEWVFPGVGRTGHLVEVKSFVSRVAKASGVAFTLHDCRRTFITIAESLDIPHYALKRMLNHRSGRDVTQSYIIIDVERLRRPVEKVAQRILEIVRYDEDSD